MKKFLVLLITIVISMFATVPAANNTVADRPEDVKYVEWAIGYHNRCGKHGKLRHNDTFVRDVNRFARRVAMSPLSLLIGTAMAETTPDERYWSALARGATLEEAKAAYNGASDFEMKAPRRASHPRWAKVDPERISFLSSDSLAEATKAKRGWCRVAELNGFDEITILAYKWYNKDDETVKEPPKEITFRGIKYMYWCSGQGGLKDGSGLYLTRKFLYMKTNGKMNHVLLDAPDGLPMNKVNQIKALSFTACQPTQATVGQFIVFEAKRRTDKAKDIVDGRPVVKVDVPNGYEMSIADEIEQALADGGCIHGPKSGIKAPAAQLRDRKGTKCASVKHKSKYIGKIVTDAFGCQVKVTEQSILSTTDNHKDIKPFLEKVKKGEMSPEEAKAAWLELRGGPDAPIYECPVHPQNGRITLGRQIFGKLSQLKDDALLKVASRDIGKLAELGFESGYKKALQRKYAALRIPELASLLDHPLLYQDMIREYLSRWHKIASGGIEVNGALAIAAIDPDWFDDVYVGGKSVDDPTAGTVKAGTILFGTKNKDGVNPMIGKKVVLARFPQVKSGLPVATIAGDAPASGIVVVSGRPGDMVLQDLDADLDGDKFYLIDDEDIIEAVERANKIFNFPHVVFTKWEAVETKETLTEYVGRCAQWMSQESVGNFAAHQFVIDEMVPYLEEGQAWETLLRPTLDENGNYSVFIPLKEIFNLNILLGVAGNMATDSGKLNHKPDAPEYITTKVAFRPMSQRDAHPNVPDSGFKKPHTAFLPDKYPGVGTNVLRRLYNLLMTLIPIQEVGRSEINDFTYNDDGKIIQDIPLRLWAPGKFEPILEPVWKHTFGNELDQIKTSLVCYPDDAETVELNQDLQVFREAKEGISLVTYFGKYASKIVNIESSLDDDKKGWTVAARDTFGDNLIKFVQTATKRKDISADDCLWLAYNALCQSFIGTQSQSRGTPYAIAQFLKLFEPMLIQQVCHNTGEKPPKIYTEKVSIKDSVTKPIVETINDEPPFDCNEDRAELQKRLTAEVRTETTTEEPPTEEYDVNALKAQLKAKTGWSLEIPVEDELNEEEE